MDGDRVDGIALLISGVVRVYKIGETGREITLYRFGLGQSCILSANAIMSQKSFPAIATVEEDAEAVMIPADAFREWVNKYDLWREFVFNLLSERLSTVMAIVDEVVFKRMDRRVASFLLIQAKGQNPMRVTHQEIAAELGSSREVISRILEDFSREELIEVGARHNRSVGFRRFGIPLGYVTLSQTKNSSSPTMWVSIKQKEIFHETQYV